MIEMTKKFIPVIVGNDTDALKRVLLSVFFDTHIDLTGYTAIFVLQSITKTLELDASKQISIVLNKSETKKLRLGEHYGELKLCAPDGKIVTVTSAIPFKITNKPGNDLGVEKPYTFICEFNNIDVIFTVGCEGCRVESVNGKTGAVIIKASDVGAYSKYQVDYRLKKKASVKDVQALQDAIQNLPPPPDLTNLFNGNIDLIKASTNTASATIDKVLDLDLQNPNAQLEADQFWLVTFKQNNTAGGMRLSLDGTSYLINVMGQVPQAINIKLYAGTEMLFYFNGTTFNMISSPIVPTGYQTVSAPLIQLMSGAYNFQRTIWMETADGKFESTVTSYSTATNKGINPAKFKIFGTILFNAATATFNPNTAYTTNEYYYLQLGDTANQLAYGFNGQGSLINNQPIYLVGIPDPDDPTLFTFDAATPTSWYTSQLPTAEDGKVYIKYGLKGTLSNVAIELNHPAFEFKNGKLRPYLALEPQAPSAAGYNYSTEETPTGETWLGKPIYRRIFSGNVPEVASGEKMISIGNYFDNILSLKGWWQTGATSTKYCAQSVRTTTNQYVFTYRGADNWSMLSFRSPNAIDGVNNCAYEIAIEYTKL